MKVSTLSQLDVLDIVAEIKAEVLRLDNGENSDEVFEGTSDLSYLWGYLNAVGKMEC
jgi:hypothetical protein